MCRGLVHRRCVVCRGLVHRRCVVCRGLVRRRCVVCRGLVRRRCGMLGLACMQHCRLALYFNVGNVCYG